MVALSSISADYGLGRAWSDMTATHPDHRGRGITQAATANDAANAPMLAVNGWLGYRPVAASFSYELDVGTARGGANGPS